MFINILTYFFELLNACVKYGEMHVVFLSVSLLKLKLRTARC